MNLFTNLYNDTDEIREWLKEDGDAAKAYLEEHQSENLDSLNLNDMAAWLTEHEDAASRYREYHYEKLWNGKNAN